MKILGVVPARMAASRFPGKPLVPILGVPMIEHVYRRAAFFSGWDDLFVATCDAEIAEWAKTADVPVVMTGSHHTRALDRVAEAAKLRDGELKEDDIVVCVQGDEPMMQPEMINAVLSPLLANASIPCVVLAMHIVDEALWRNPDTVKIIHNEHGEVLYTSRAAVPFCRGEFTPALVARRIYGIFSFRWRYLKEFTAHCETRLEQLEACDSNRILDMPFSQYIAPYPHVKSYSVDSPSDIDLVELNMRQDETWGRYGDAQRKKLDGL